MSDNEATNYFIDISGRNELNKPKAHVSLIFSLRFNDGTAIEKQQLTISQKPIVSVFKHAGYVNVYLDFLSCEDNDLALAWNLLSDYSSPENSIDWSDEELESGCYIGEDEKEHQIYFPMIELILSPFGRETEYIMRGLNPAFYTLQPNDPKGFPCVLQLTFPEDWFFVDDKIDPIDLESLRKEVSEEFGMTSAPFERYSEHR